MDLSDIIWGLVYTALGLGIVFMALRTRKLRRELEELNEENARRERGESGEQDPGGEDS